ncbi:MAG: hypothetical protein FJ034_06360, partial [Chloroflexi bacterium]|nr:hypothetical protein [Chloroflexota bacterium]
MSLELRSFDVRTVTLGSATAFQGGTLTVSVEELTALAGSDPVFSGVTLELVAAGEAARLTQITDAFEPRVKVGSAAIFPGTLGPVEAVGTGKTNRLAGVAVIMEGEVPWLGAKGLFVPHDNILDADGPGTEYHPYGGLHLVVLRASYAEGVDHEGIQRAMLGAGLRVARRLAETTLALEPDRVEVRDLTPKPGLPTVAYAYQVQSQGVFLRAHLMGRMLDELVPTLVSANEIADGALVSGGLGGHGAKLHTWMHQNNPIIERLVAGHGTKWNFAGVILHRGHYYLYEDKQRIALRVAETASMLGADGVIFTLGGVG